MTTSDRRNFLRLMGGTSVAAAFSESIDRALALPANCQNRSIQDVEHIVILMQENRSFDHYFGSLRGVRGFSDPHPVTLPSGKPVWYQADGDSTVLPFHPTAANLGFQFIEDLAHDWTSTHGAWNFGNWDQWVPNKGTTTMAYLTRKDIPFHYALADAFTVCDAYHCSLLGPTDPNRYYMWTGWVGNDGKNGGPVIDNAELGYDWSTFPEVLQNAGITWKIYQDAGVGLTGPGYWGWTEDPYIGNYGDNSLLYFHQYQNAAAGTPLAVGAKTGTDISSSGTLFDVLAADIKAGKLPQVSWVVAPEAYTEHPNWPANWGAWYTSQILDALTANPEIWGKTAFFITFDENDGFFDHMPSPHAPMSSAQGLSTVDTTNEIFEGAPSYPVADYPAGPFGLGVRVPMIVVSPWSKGGFVCSEVFDHTSLIQFIQKRFGTHNAPLTETNVTAWRQAVCGDLTSAFNFESPDTRLPSLPKTTSYAPSNATIAAGTRFPDYDPTVPTTQTLPAQEPGQRYARALPYSLAVADTVSTSAHTVALSFLNTSTVGAFFQVRSGDGVSGPWAFTVGAGHSLNYDWNFASASGNAYDLSVFGPNGFVRHFTGHAAAGYADLSVVATTDARDYAIALTIENLTATPTKVAILDVYTNRSVTAVLPAHGRVVKEWSLREMGGWYDLQVSSDTDKSFTRRLSGHVENGRDSVTDPAIGASV